MKYPIVVAVGCALSCGSPSGFGTDAGGDAISVGDAAAGDAGCGALLSCDGVCVKAAACDFSVTSLAPRSGALNGGNFVTLHGHGFAKGMRVDLGDGRAVVRVIDAATALIMVPPALVGSVDVVVTAGTTSTTLPSGYRYVAGSLGAAWVKPSMNAPRGVYPGVALMQDGRVLVAGGAPTPSEVPTNTAEIYDPTTSLATLVTSTMTVAREEEAAVTLMNGEVLLAGNWGGPSAIADVFDPVANAFHKSASDMVVARGATLGVLLVDERVLVTSDSTPSIEIFDPAAEAFSALASAPVIAQPADAIWPVRLRDGRVLLVIGADGGGARRQCMVFDPDTNALSPAGLGPAEWLWANSPRETPVALAADGRVFVFGGLDVGSGYVPSKAVEVFDPTTTTGFAPFGQVLSVAREAPGAVLLSDGRIIVIGGNTTPSSYSRDCTMTFTPTSSIDIIDPLAKTVTAFAPAFPDTTWTLTAATLLDGSLIAAGGLTCGTGSTSYPYLYFLQGTLPN